MELYQYSNIGSRAENEDTGACEQLDEHRAFAIVADGLGGHGGGQEASRTAVKAILQCRQEVSLPDAARITGWLEEANAEILAKRNGPQHMKTTVVVLFLWNNQAIWGHIGDSRLYHFHNGRLADFTLDHSLCQIAVKLGDITRRDIPGHPDRSKILRALGNDQVQPEFHGPVDLAPGDHAFLLCSDGLWERLYEDEILADLHKSATPEQWVQSLRCRAQLRKSTDVDNNTAAAIFLTV